MKEGNIMTLETLDELIESLEEKSSRDYYETFILFLAKEIKEIKSLVITQKLLIEHEEKLRLNRQLAKLPNPRKKPNTVYKAGDRVCKRRDSSKKGTVKMVSIDGKRLQVHWDTAAVLWHPVSEIDWAKIEV